MPEAARSIPVVRTAWYCERCAASGSVVIQPDSEATAELVRLAHAARSPACDRQEHTTYVHILE